MSMISLGPYTTGEIPAPLQVNFQDSTKAALDLSTGVYVARWIYRSRNGAAVTQTATLINAAGGITRYTWVAADFATAGDFEGEMWIGNGTNRFCSQRYSWHVHQAIAVPVI